jgi:PAS domain S-box-containing protein
MVPTGSLSLHRNSNSVLGRFFEQGCTVPSFSGWTVATRITVVVLTLALPLILAIFAVIWQMSRGANEVQRTNLLYTARSVAAAVDAKLEQYIALTEALALSPAVLEDNLDVFEAEARRAFASSLDTSVLLADLEGRQLISTRRDPGQHHSVRSSLGFAAQKRAFETHSTVITDARTSMVPPAWVISIEVPIFKNGQPFRALSVNVKALSFIRLLDTQEMPKNWHACIVDRQGRYLARIPDNERYAGQFTSAAWRELKDQSGVFEMLSRDGDPVIAAHVHSAFSGWTVGIAVKKVEMQSAVWDAIRWAAILGGGFSALSLFFAGIMARSITGPIARLRQKAGALMNGPWPSNPQGPPEIRELWQALTQSEADRDRSGRALRESEQRLRGIFEHAGTGIAVADLEGRFQTCNPAYAAMLGYSEQELRGLVCLALIHPEDREANAAEKRRLLAQEISSFEIVNRYIGKGGKLIWVHKHVSLLCDTEGNPAYTSVLATDITERKRQEDHIRLLMREVNHRSKNLLTVVQAIARQTAAGAPNDFASRFEQRVQALAASQDELVKNDWRGAKLDELVRSQLAHFEDLIGTRIRLQGPPLFVTASAAQALGMTLHELATNAGKYGALANCDGRVAIEWGLEEEEAGGRAFAICWREQGKCPVKPPSKRGFGSTVLCEMAELSLDAKVDLTFLASGLIWRLQCSAGQILEESHPIRITKNKRRAMSSTAAPGRSRVLVLEDEAVVAIEIAQVLLKAGFEVVGPARAASQALQLVDELGCDVAVLDVNLGNETSERVALKLRERGTPFITLSGYSKEQHPLVFNGARSLAKPLRPESLIAELEACMAIRSETSQESAALPVHQLSAVS